MFLAFLKHLKTHYNTTIHRTQQFITSKKRGWSMIPSLQHGLFLMTCPLNTAAQESDRQTKLNKPPTIQFANHGFEIDSSEPRRTHGNPLTCETLPDDVGSPPLQHQATPRGIGARHPDIDKSVWSTSGMHGSETWPLRTWEGLGALLPQHGHSIFVAPVAAIHWWHAWIWVSMGMHCHMLGASIFLNASHTLA